MDAEPAAADGLPDTARGADMRRTYPAGRILHLVPARLAFPYFQPPDSGAPSSMWQDVSVPIPHLIVTRCVPARRILHLMPARLAFPYFQPPHSG